MKKLLLAVPIVFLLAAGCNSSAPSQGSSTTNYGQDQRAAKAATPTPGMTAPTASAAMSGGQNSMSASWQATLMTSTNSAKGKYMIMSGGHTIYLNTSRDYSQLVGKMVNVSYTGSMASFTLGNITAQ